MTGATRRSVLLFGAAAGALGGCRPAGHGAPSHDAVTGAVTAATPPPQTLGGTSVARYFGPALVPEARDVFGLGRAEMMPSGDTRLGTMLRVFYPAGAANPSPVYADETTYGGTQVFLATRIKPPLQLFLRYYVRFPPDFAFGKGGKLPGFYGVTVKGDKRLTTSQDGFATRFAWRKRGFGAVAGYLPNATGHLTTIGKNTWKWRLGGWVCVEQGIRLNVPGRPDGSVDIWIDGVPVHSERTIAFRNADRLRIGGVVFSTYFGGGDGTFDPGLNQYADFAGLAIAPSRIGPVRGHL